MSRLRYPWNKQDLILKFLGLGIGGYALSWRSNLSLIQYLAIVFWFAAHLTVLCLTFLEPRFARREVRRHPRKPIWRVKLASGEAAAVREELASTFPWLSAAGISAALTEIRVNQDRGSDGKD